MARLGRRPKVRVRSLTTLNSLHHHLQAPTIRTTLTATSPSGHKTRRCVKKLNFDTPPPVFSVKFPRGLVAISEEAEQVEEQVDKVEVERQGADGGEAARSYLVGGGHALYPLGIPGGKADENQHTDG